MSAAPSDASPFAAAIDLLEDYRRQLAQIHRGKHYAQWRPGAVHELDSALAGLAPFDAHVETRIFTGDGGSLHASSRFGAWAIDHLVASETPQSILKAFAQEVARNAATYLDVTPLFGVALDGTCELADGVRIVPAADASLWWNPQAAHRWMPVPQPPNGSAFLTQSYRVTPAFAPATDGSGPGASSATVPPAPARDAVRQQVRLACILAGAGAVELPLSFIDPDRTSLFAGGDGNIVSRPIAAYPLVSFPTEAAAVKRMFDHLAAFAEPPSLARAIDRLGRSRLARSPVDQALELGIATEIALMHGDQSSNTEITHKIGARMSWLLGQSPEERAAIFDQCKALYHARSKAVHEGVLPKKSKIDLADADRLVARTLAAIAERGRFPNWSSLTMGGTG
jgi:hypothetical protein